MRQSLGLCTGSDETKAAVRDMVMLEMDPFRLYFGREKENTVNKDV